MDLCIRLPKNRKEMLKVSGVGENKCSKYGQRFMDEIKAFVMENPGAVTSLVTGDENGI